MPYRATGLPSGRPPKHGHLPPETKDEVETAASAGDLSRVFALLTKASEEKRADDAVRGIRDAIALLSTEERGKLIENEDFQRLLQGAIQKPEGRPAPGSTLKSHDGQVMSKVPWSVKDIRERFPMVTWTPTRTVPVTVHGHTIQLYEGLEITAPACFHEVWLHSIQGDREGQQRVESLIRETTGMDVSIDREGVAPRAP